MATAQPTTDPDEIRRWVEARGGHPARVKATGRKKDPGILRIDFPGFSGEDTLEEIEWDEFFEWFDRNGLAMLLSDAKGNRFNKLVSRRTVKKVSTKKASAKKAPAKKASSKKVSARKATTRKASTKKASAKKATTKKASAKKASAKKTSTKRASSKKASSTKRAPSKKVSTKKASTKKASTKKASSKKRGQRATSSKQRRTSSSVTTTDHDEIRRWVESRGGYPATVKGTESRGEEAGLLRIDYPGYSGAGTLERIEWDDFFEKFDAEGLAFLYQNKRGSRFSKLVRR